MVRADPFILLLLPLLLPVTVPSTACYLLLLPLLLTTHNTICFESGVTSIKRSITLH